MNNCMLPCFSVLCQCMVVQITFSDQQLLTESYKVDLFTNFYNLPICLGFANDKEMNFELCPHLVHGYQIKTIGTESLASFPCRFSPQ